MDAERAVGFPLQWPTGQRRTPLHERKRGSFKVTFDQARRAMMHELQLLGSEDGAVLSSNLQLRLDGQPYSDRRATPTDPGVALYFWRDRKQLVIACDAYDTVGANIRALGLTLDAFRAIERHGSASILERAFTGFMALPAATQLEQAWPEVLGVARTASAAEIKAARDRLAMLHHTDRGGEHEMIARINRAYDQAQEALRGR